MHTETMEGLAGASTNMKLLNTPFRVYKDAERRGDTAVMERAMGYVGDFAEKAEDYQKKAEKGMKEDAKEAREKAKTEHPSQLLAFAYVWSTGLREPLAKTAYRDIWINFTSLFVLLCIINTVTLVYRKKKRQKGKGEK